MPDPRNINSYREPPPANKEVEISLLYMWETGRWQVVTVTNTTWYRPGDWLSEEVVDAICKIPRWTIKMQSYELLSKLVSFIKPNLVL